MVNFLALIQIYTKSFKILQALTFLWVQKLNSSIILIDSDDIDYDAIACETIKKNWFGVVQDGGNKEAYLNYLSTHEIIN